jgi:hypothetical protein
MFPRDQSLNVKSNWPRKWLLCSQNLSCECSRHMSWKHGRNVHATRFLWFRRTFHQTWLPCSQNMRYSCFRHVSWESCQSMWPQNMYYCCRANQGPDWWTCITVAESIKALIGEHVLLLQSQSRPWLVNMYYCCRANQGPDWWTCITVAEPIKALIGEHVLLLQS